MSQSKERKRQLKRQYKEQLANAPALVFVISDLVTEALVEKRLLAEFHAVGICPEIVKSDKEELLYFVRQPSKHVHQVGIKLGTVDDLLLAEFENVENFMDRSLEHLRGLPMAALSSKVRVSPVNDLLLSASIRVFGRLTKGILATDQALSDDWISWSLDYMGKTMADVSRVYDAECPDFAAVLKTNPDLVYKRPWWKIGKS